MAKKSRISPMLKRAVSHIFTKPATTKYPFVKPTLPEDFRWTNKSIDIKLMHRVVVYCSREIALPKQSKWWKWTAKDVHKSSLTNAFSATNVLKAAPETPSKAQFSTS